MFLFGATFDDQTIIANLEKIESQKTSDIDENQVILFLAEIAGRAGASRTKKTGVETAEKALDLAARILQNTESPPTRDAIKMEFAAASEKIKIHYPILADDISKNIQIASQSITW